MDGHCAVAMATIGTIRAPVVAPGVADTPTSSACPRTDPSRCYGPPKVKLRDAFSRLLSNRCARFSAQNVGRVEGNLRLESSRRAEKQVPARAIDLSRGLKMGDPTKFIVGRKLKLGSGRNSVST